MSVFGFFLFFFKQKTAYEMRISDWSSDVCSSDLSVEAVGYAAHLRRVLVDVGVEQVQRDAPDLGLPDASHERRARQVDLDADAIAGRDGHGVRVEIGVALLLPAVGRDRKSTRLNSSH